MLFVSMFQRSKPELVSWRSTRPVGPDEVKTTVSGPTLVQIIFVSSTTGCSMWS
jgi:hypothetical protein